MKNRTFSRIAAGLAGSLALASVTTFGATSSATAAPGNTSLAEVLAADGAKLDKNWKDFDIVEAAVLTVLDAKPRSPLRLITKGGQRLTVFLPNDAAFRRLVKDLTGKQPKSEKATVNAVLSVADVDTLETILLYHVLPGKTLVSERVVARAGREGGYRSAIGASVGIRAAGKTVKLVDADPDDVNARVYLPLLDINRGNKQVAHGINRVLRPIDL